MEIRKTLTDVKRFDTLNGMESSTVSSKYQVVIPKKLRKQLQLKPGQKVYLSNAGPGKVTIETASQVKKLYGSMKGVWGKNSSEFLKKQRDEWDGRHDRP